MIPEIITFSKSMSCRLQEFENLLSEIDTPCSKINEIWSSIFQDLVIPKLGWLALWIVSEENCMIYDLLYPTAVIVKVEKYDWDDLSAIVSVAAVQDDIVLPSSLDVPLIELHPIKVQKYNESDLKIIADWLDKCRYFFKFLWYPWDTTMKYKLSDWCQYHLEKRLKIQCDIQNGLFEKNVMQYYTSLIEESKKIQACLDTVNSEDMSKSEKIGFIKNCIRRKVLKMELDFFEEPDLRDDLIALRQIGQEFEECKKKIIVWGGGNMDSLMTFLTCAKSNIDNDTVVKVSSNFQEALDSSNPGDSVLLPTGSHVLKSLQALHLGGVIEGLGEPYETKIFPDCLGTKRAILFKSFGELIIRNLTVKLKEGIAFLASENSLKISNCCILGEGSSATKGVTVLPGCTLVLENCLIKGFRIGIAAQKGATVTISNTRIVDCHGGIKVTDGSEVTLEDVEISRCSEYGACLEISKFNSDLPLTGDLDFFLNHSGDDSKFVFEKIVMADNPKCDYLVTKNLDDYIQDHFDPDVSYETVLISDEAMSD